MIQADSISTVLYICTFIITLSSAINVISTWVAKARDPEERQNERIAAIEEDLKIIKQKLDNDNKRIKILEDGNRVTQMALLALMSHAINGDDIDKLTEAKTKLEQYLITK